MTYCDLIVETKTPPERQYFTYLIPPEFNNKIQVGLVVRINFGRRKLRGLVIKIHNHRPDYLVKPITALLPYHFTEKRIKTIFWLSKYYFCSLGESLKLFLPPDMVRPQKISPKGTQPLPVKIRQTTVLNNDQEKVYQKIISDWKQNQFKHLLWGVTGSGKTEIYIKLIRECLKNNGQVIYLLPEIFLASVILKRLENIFKDNIKIVHSKVSKSELLFIYQKFYSGEIKIIVGPRSALSFIPKNLKLIIIDEEQDDSYRQEQSPRYDARHLAEKISEFEQVNLLFGTATPRIETFYRAQNNEYGLLELKNRYQQLLPEAKIVDMRQEIRKKNYSILSESLCDELSYAIEHQHKVILYLNRRGLATFVSCRDCGHIETCPNCNLPLTHHLNQGRDVLTCHQCDYQTVLPSRCSSCGSAFIKSFGTGIQRVESEIRKLFPKSKILRLDSDLKESEFNEIARQIHENNFDILIGTQIIAKGLDLPDVDLVGIISADTVLHLPDYHSGERTFQQITQVSGRSGRRHRQGKTIIQTYWPENQAIKFAALHDFRSFYDIEIGVRKIFNYPPFMSISRIISQDKDKKTAKGKLDELSKRLAENNFQFSGPATAFYKKIRNSYRYHLIIKFNDKDRQHLYELLKKYANNLIIEIDPTQLL